MNHSVKSTFDKGDNLSTAIQDKDGVPNIRSSEKGEGPDKSAPDVPVRIILGSGSPRRIEMMKDHEIDPLICPADVEENLPLNSGMEETVMFLSLKKAKAVEEIILSKFRNGDLPADETGSSVIIAADTIVYSDGEIMGKPVDFDDGFRMLSKLRNSTHFVATGVCLLEVGAMHTEVFCEITEVSFRDYSDEELKAYLQTDEAYDKAGGYAIQGSFGRYIDKIDGLYSNVIGFPWERISKELEHFGISVN